MSKRFKSIKELREELNEKQKVYDSCEHDFDDKPVFCMAVGRFGGECVNIYRCKKCGFESSKEDEYEKAISKYDDSGMPIE